MPTNTHMTTATIPLVFVLLFFLLLISNSPSCHLCFPSLLHNLWRTCKPPSEHAVSIANLRGPPLCCRSRRDGSHGFDDANMFGYCSLRFFSKRERCGFSICYADVQLKGLQHGAWMTTRFSGCHICCWVPASLAW